eukprot:CCRYP_018398-RA/>CCRYP_018398-RA protein AED:0.40 eAED:0.40 QI:0/-1/0/1/-1/1/1/0/87
MEPHQAVSDKPGRCKEGERVEDGRRWWKHCHLRQGPKVKKRLDRMKETGAWLAVIPTASAGRLSASKNGMTTSACGMGRPQGLAQEM